MVPPIACLCLCASPGVLCDSALHSAPMSPDEAVIILRGSSTVPVMEGALSYIKELHGLCLRNGVPAAIVRPRRKGGG